MAGEGKRKRTGCWIAVVVVVGMLGYAGVRFGPDTLTAYRQGFLEGTRMREFSGGAIDNLRALHTALMLYHDSEGQFPAASGWMDAIEPRLRTADMKPEEAAKRLKDPRLSDPAAYGFALNTAVAGKFKDDVGDGKTVLVFATSKTGRNASGDPKADARREAPLAISIDGTVAGVPSQGQP